MDCIERVARALCTCAGKDPEEPHFTDKMKISREKGHMVQRHVQVPLWTTYVSEARKFIAVHESLSSTADPLPDIVQKSSPDCPRETAADRQPRDVGDAKGGVFPRCPT